jgi:very-short-patch-repair endonuclease
LIELRRVVWAWDGVLDRLQREWPDIGVPLMRSTRALAAERLPDGGLDLVLGSWWQPDYELLVDPPTRARVTEALGNVLEESVRLSIVLWPGLDGTPPPTAAPEQPPDPLAGLPMGARHEAAACESTLQRRFFAAAWRRGLKLECQRPVLIYRLDFVVPRTLLGVEILAWRSREHVEGWDRVRDLGAEGWRIISFAGEEIHRAVEHCVDELQAEIARG